MTNHQPAHDERPDDNPPSRRMSLVSGATTSHALAPPRTDSQPHVEGVGINELERDPELQAHNPVYPEPRVENATTTPPTGTDAIHRPIVLELADLQSDGDKFLAYLANTNRLSIKQEVDMCAVMMNCVEQVKFSILDEGGNILFYVCEESNCCTRQFFQKSRSYRIKVTDRTGTLMMQMLRPFNCSLCCGLISPDEMGVYLPTHKRLGSVKQKFSLKASFDIHNTLNQPIMRLRGSFFPITCCANQSVEFTLTTMDRRPIGKLLKHWSGLAKELCTDCDNFTLEFPINATPQEKALLLAASNLVNIRHFESPGIVNICLRIIFCMLILRLIY